MATRCVVVSNAPRCASLSSDLFSLLPVGCRGTTTVGASLAGASERVPTVVGKPSPFILDDIRAACGGDLAPADMCVVGDRLDTDVLWGNTSGLGTVLVLTGVTSSEQARAPVGSLKPTYIVDSVADLLPR